MKFDFVVAAANGIQGKIVSRDLLENGFSVLLCANDDYKMDHLIEHKNSDFALVDLRKTDRVKRIIKKSGASVVVNCAIDTFDLPVMKACLDLGIHHIDLGSEWDMTKEQLALDKECKEKSITCITGCGSTPGINNVMLRYAQEKFDTVETIQAGFVWDSNIAKFVTPFSLETIVEELVEKAPIYEHGHLVEKEPTECDIAYYFKSVGKQKVCFTKHIEVHTFHQYLKNKGVKNIAFFSGFPSHSARAMKTLIELGLSSKNELEFQNMKVKPIDFISEVVRHLEIPEGYEEKENLWVKIWGKKDDKDLAIEMDCIASTLPGWESDTCNIDTGMPASIIAQMIKDGRIAERGSFIPEEVIPPLPFFEELAKRKIWVYENDQKIN